MGVFLSQIVNLSAGFYDFFMYIGLPLMRTLDELTALELNSAILTYYNPISQVDKTLIVNGFTNVMAEIAKLVGLPGDTLFMVALFMALAVGFALVLAVGLGKLIVGFIVS